MELAITTERAGEKGWIAFAAGVRATAQGATEQEAKRNLRSLLERTRTSWMSYDRRRTAASS